MALTAKKVYAILKRQISDMEAKLNSPVRYRGTVATADLLPLNPDIGDMYNIESKSVYGEAGMNVAWNGVVWDTMGAPIDMSLYIKSSELADWAKQQSKPTYTAEEVGALPADTKIPSKTSDLQNDSGFLTKIPDNYLFGTDKTLSVSGKAADAKTVGDKNVELLANILSKLDKNQGSENSGKIAGINESGDIVPMFPMGVEYNSETNCLEFGSDQGMKLNQGIGLDSTLTKTGFAADAGVTGKEINSLKESISNKITKFYASNQGETHLQDSDDGKIMDMMVYGKSEQKQYSGKNLINGAHLSFLKDAIMFDIDKVIVNGTISEDLGASFSKIQLKAGTYTLSSSFNCISKIGINPNLGILNADNKFKTLTINEDMEINLVVIVPSGSHNSIDYIMFNEGSDALSWEPYTGGIPSPNPDYPQEIKSVVNPTVKVSNEDGTKSQTVTLPYTLNAIPVSSGGNVTIDGQQYIADYVDVERGKLVQRIWKGEFDGSNDENWRIDTYVRYYISIPAIGVDYDYKKAYSYCNRHKYNTKVYLDANRENGFIRSSRMFYFRNDNITDLSLDNLRAYLAEHPLIIITYLNDPVEIDLTEEEIAAFKALATYYPVTNISVNSEQLDGYTVFNYPISMENGWNYVKQQIGDTRDYIYDMDARTQDTDLQAAEAYVNSEYAVTLTELEV